MRDAEGIFHFNGCVFTFMVTFYLWQWCWLYLWGDGKCPFIPT
jgi:hypothetical protein